MVLDLLLPASAGVYGDRIIIALVVMIVSIAVSVVGLLLPRFIDVPFFWRFFAAASGRFGDRLNRKGRDRRELIFRGTIFFVFSAGALVSLISYCAYVWPFIHWLWDLLILFLCFGGFSSVFLLVKMFKSAEKTGDFSSGVLKRLEQVSRLDLKLSDGFSLTRAGFNYAVFAFVFQCVGALFYYIWLGVEGALFYSALAAYVWRFGDYGRGGAFATLVCCLARFVAFLPNLLASVFVFFAALFTPGSDKRAAFVRLDSDLLLGGRSLAVVAAALRVSLGGAYNSSSGYALKPVWVGRDQDSAKVGTGYYKRIIFMLNLSYLLVFMTLMALYRLIA